MVLATGLSRVQRFGEAVEVLDRASSSLEPRDSELALLLEAAAIAPAMNDAATAPSVALRSTTLREQVGAHPAPRELPLAVSAFTSVLSNEPAEVGVELATRALVAGGSTLGGSRGRPWFSFATWFS